MDYEPTWEKHEDDDDETEYVELSVIVSRDVAEAIDAEYAERRRRRERVLADRFGDEELAEAATDEGDVGDEVGQRMAKLLLDARPDLRKHR